PSTSGVASRLSLFDVPPSATANISLRFFRIDPVDRIERGVALRGVVVMVHQPVLWFRIDKPLVGRVRGTRWKGACEQRTESSKHGGAAVLGHRHKFLPVSTRAANRFSHSPNTHTTVALPCMRSSGVRATRPRLLRGSGAPRPSQHKPDAIAMY